MSLFEDMSMDTPDVPSASDFLVRGEAATADFGVAQVDNAQALGAMRAVGTDLQSASNMAQSLSAGVDTAHGVVHTLRSVNEEGARVPAVGTAIADMAKEGIAEWVKERPEAAWRFVKQETASAWDVGGVATDAREAAATEEGNAEITGGAKKAASSPVRFDRERGAIHGRATNRLAQWDHKAARQQKKADKLAAKIAKRAPSSAAAPSGAAGAAAAVGKAGIGKAGAKAGAGKGRAGRKGGQSFAKFRQRYHQSKAARLRGEDDGVLGSILKARRKKNEVQVNVTRRQFLLLAGGAIVAVPLALGMVTSCTGGLISGVAGAVAGGNVQSDALSEIENQVASFLVGKGLDPMHAAAIMGNMYAESSMNPALTETGGTGIGLCQWSFGRADGLRSYAASVGTDWSDLATQLDFFWERDSRMYSADWGSSYVITDSRVSNFPGDPAVGTRVSGSKVTFEQTSDLDQAVEQFCYGWESPGIPRISVRKQAAQRYYLAFSSSSEGSGPVPEGGPDYASAEQWQKDIADACHSVGWPGASLCATWTSRVYAACGYTVRGNGNSQLGHQGSGASYYDARATTDLSQIQVGMLISSQYGSNTSAGNMYGHVGIYIGDGMVMDSISTGIRTISLSSWVSQNNRGWVVCGYPWDWR